MGEIKSVKVDNWGVFFLQKLQNFFNKTDYCDLTLQFRDNSQLKVHRLVLSACTDYFNVLEQTCEVVDDALIMPNELQADVVVPIVNFMYTGTLEFELKMYGKLLRTAKEMNMTVLLKLLEAHRRTMENVNRAQRPPSPKAIRRRTPAGMQTIPANSSQFQNQSQQIRRTDIGNTVVQRRVIQTKTAGTNMSPALQVYRQQIGSTSVVRTSALKTNQPTIQAYIKNEPEEYETIATTQPTSPFEQLRKGYNNNKRPAVTTFTSPPTKKPNLEDVKEFAEQQRMRKQIAAEYGDDQEFEGMMDDDIHNDDDDDDAAVNAPAQSSAASNAASIEGARSTSITFKQESDGQPPTIIVKDSSGSKLNHAKIISEVLRQYPHLAKGNKNIKLKIMPNSTGQTQRVVVKKDPEQQQFIQQSTPKPLIQQKTILPAQLLSSQVTVRAGDRVVAAAKATLPSPQKPVVAPPNVVADNSQQKRRIDSKTMHALIALGAENMTGPWLCLRCGVNGRPISIPSYRGFRRHLINTHKETIDSALCEHCGWRSRTNRELHFHMQVEHKIKTTLYTFPECLLCTELFLDTNALNQHMLDSHPSANKQQCIYCNKIFVKEMQLYTHMKLYHKHQAIEDGIIDASDDELGITHGEEGDEEEHLDSDSERVISKSSTEHKDAKVKILSDISLPMASSIIKMENTSVKGTIDVNTIDAQTKFVTADGNEMILTEEQRKEIMSQLNQDQNNGGVVMVLHEAIFPSGEAIESETAASVEETTSARGDIASEEELDDSQIYAELASSQNATSRDKTGKVDLQGDGKESLDNLEWAENLISEHDLADTGNSAVTKKDDEDKTKKDDISQKLKELTGDWSEDENEEEDDLGKSEKPDTDSAGKISIETKENLKTNEMEELSTETEKETVDSVDDKSSSSKKKKEDSDEVEEDFIEETVESETKNETDKSEQDDLDLAMQNLHEGEDIKTEKNLSSEGLQSLVEEIKMDVDEVKKEDDIAESVLTKASGSKVEQNATTTTSNTIINTASEDVDHSTALLDELMSTTDDANLDAQKSKVIDDFEDAELNDVEEFTSLEKSEQQQQPSNAPITKEVKSSTAVDTKSDEETKSTAKDTASETTAAVAKSLSSDWEDIEDDDDDMVGIASNDDAE